MGFSLAVSLSYTTSLALADPTSERVLAKVIDSKSGRFQIDHRVYQPASPQEFSNGAVVETRWSVPSGTRPTLAADGRIELPDGAVLSKTYRYRTDQEVPPATPCEQTRIVPVVDSPSAAIVPGRTCRVELRILAKSKGEWHAHVFRPSSGTEWTPAPGGRDVDFEVSRPKKDEQRVRYSIPSIGECRACHMGRRSDAAFGPIGINVDRLSDRSRLDFLSDAASSPGFRAELERFDRAAAGAHGARRYLDANCGFCHNPNGLAASSALMLDRAESDASLLGVCKRPVALGMEHSWGRYDIEPGRPERSILIGRMSSLTPSLAMPELGRSLIDTRGIAIVSDWIREMKGQCPGVGLGVDAGRSTDRQ